MARLPVMAARSGTSRVSCSHCAPLRPSFHRMAGRSTLSCSSSKVAPCIWPERPMPRSRARACGCSRCSWSITASSACHQAAGSCSDHMACGRCTVSGARAVAMTSCCSDSSRALSSEVPRSIPRYMVGVVGEEDLSGAGPPQAGSALPGTCPEREVQPKAPPGRLCRTASAAPLGEGDAKRRGGAFYLRRAAEAVERLLAELARRHALGFEEAAVEVGDVVEANLVADVGDLLVAVHQQLAGAADAHAVCQ